jgi:hypothetical protein
MQPILNRGTSLLILPTNEGIAVAADDLVYEISNGVAVPKLTGVWKVFSANENIVLGTTQNMWLKLSEPITFEYKAQDWLAEFLGPEGSVSECDPEQIAVSIYEKARQTFEPIDSLIRNGQWNKQGPCETFINYMVAGYPKDFGEYSLFNINIKIDAKGKGLDFGAVENHTAQFRQLSWYGEDQFLTLAREGFDPEAAMFTRTRAECLATMQTRLPQISHSLQESAAYIAGLIKVEAYFNKYKVGRAVNTVVIDKTTRKSYSATL